MSTTVPKRRGRRTEPRQMLALIALATNLPVPTNIRFADENMQLNLATIADAALWANHFGLTISTEVHDGSVWLRCDVAQWRGWPMHLVAWENEPKNQHLDKKTTGQLTALTAPEPELAEVTAP